MTSEHPPLLFDYDGFPPESYKLTWPAPGSPPLASRVRALLEGAGLKTGEDATRGFDHGAFVPFKVTWPNAEIPTIQLSLKQGLDPAVHLAMGRALQPLRDEGVLILGSGMTFHNLRAFGDPRAPAVARSFDAWLVEAATARNPKRDQQLLGWERAPAARQAHPREEHLIPLMVVAGAAGDDEGKLAWSGTMFGCQLSAFHYG